MCVGHTDGIEEVTWHVNGARNWIRRIVPGLLAAVVFFSIFAIWDVLYYDGGLGLSILIILIPAAIFGLGIQPLMYPFMIGVSPKAIHLKYRRGNVQRIILWKDIGSIIFRTIRLPGQVPSQWKKIRLIFNDGTSKLLPLNVSVKIFEIFRETSSMDNPAIFWRDAENP